MRRAALSSLLALVVASLVAGAQPAAAAPRAEPGTIATQPPSLPGAPACGPSKASPTAPQTGRDDTNRVPAPIYFAHDFPLFHDSDVDPELGAVGGFGGIRFRAPLHHTPVIFVHGNQADAQNWLDVMTQFQQLAGYTMQEMYALSYNGLENYYPATPDQLPPTTLDQAYINQNTSVLANGGKGAADDDNVPDLCRFVEAVQWYTGSAQVDIVSHSLGVTIVRRFMELYPSLATDVAAFVGIAGANHGTTVCRGLDTSYYGCDEIAPGTQWLDQLDQYGETYGPTHWMTVYDGAEGDPLFIGPDVGSPQLAGADNRTFNSAGIHGDYHNDLRVDPPEVETYLAFLLQHGQAGPFAARNVDALAQGIAQRGQQDEASNQQAPSIYQLADAPLCIPDLTGTQDGCVLPEAVPSGSPGGPGPIAGPPAPARSIAALPNTSGPGAPASASAAALIALCTLPVLRRRRRRQRMPVS